jgi:hypothetical protein
LKRGVATMGRRKSSDRGSGSGFGGLRSGPESPTPPPSAEAAAVAGVAAAGVGETQVFLNGKR